MKEKIRQYVNQIGTKLEAVRNFSPAGFLRTI